MEGQPEYILLSVSLGVIVGAIGAFFGVGGGFMVTPFLHTVIGLTAAESVATSTGQIVLLSSSAGWYYFREGLIKFRAAFYLLLGSLPSALFFAWLIGRVQHSPFASQIVWLGMSKADLTLLVVFTVGIGTLGCYNLYRAGLLQASTESTGQSQIFNKMEAVAVGVLTGTSAAVLGIGGGFITFPYLVYRCKMLPTEAVATGICVMWVTTLIASGKYISSGTLRLGPALAIGIGGVIGAQIGARMILNVSPRTVVKTLGVLQLLVAILYSIGKINLG